MGKAEVGDDGFKEDPPTNILEERCAKMFNMEAALFVPSGTMANLIAVMTHCPERGQEAILGKISDLFLWEGGCLSQFGGIHVNALANREDGTMDLEEIKENIRNPNNESMPKTGVVVVENTQNRCGGVCLPVSYFQDLRKLTDEHGVAVHMDGARLLNACIAEGVEPREYTDLVDSVCLAMCKGLGAPVGAILAGSTDFIKRSRKARKAIGGQMRQIGPLTAAANFSLDHNVEKMKDDHVNARRLAQVVADHGGDLARVDMSKVQTNIVYITLKQLDVMNAAQFCKRMAEVTEKEMAYFGSPIVVKMSPFSESDVRFVTHISASGNLIDQAVKKMEYVLMEMNQNLRQEAALRS